MDTEMNQGGSYRPVTSRISYLIGVPSEYLDQIEREAYDKQRPYRIIRQMNKLRTAIMANYDCINEQFKAGKFFDDIPVTQKAYLKLVKEHAAIDRDASLSKTIININNWIYGMVNKIMLDFPEYAHRDWIRDMLIMPKGTTTDGVRVAIKKFNENKAHYPYQMYLNWDFALTTEENKLHNILITDEYFAQVVTERYAPIGKSENAMQFFDEAKKVAVIVDCENSNPAKLFSMIRDIGRKDIKIILIDDANTTSMWQDFADLANETGIITEREEIQRLKQEKSLVDLRMVARACEEHYQREVDSFVLATSDSDIWALIQSLPNARFVVVSERAKGGTLMFSALTEHSIPCWFLDNYTEDEELTNRAMYRAANEILSKRSVCVEDLVLDAAASIMTLMPQDKMQMYVDKWSNNIVQAFDDERKIVSLRIAGDTSDPMVELVDHTDADVDGIPEDIDECDNLECKEAVSTHKPIPVNIPKKNIPAKKSGKKKTSKKKKRK